MEPKIVRLPAFTVVGMKYRGKSEQNEIPQLWSRFVPRIGEIQHRPPGGPTYGVMDHYDETTGEYDYVASLPVDRAADLPDGMVAVEVPAAQYAVVDCTLPEIGAAYKQINAWVAQSEYERAPTPDFEYYGPGFNPQDPGSVMSLYLPIQ
jgi:predicted transcriptional regulator YdeE